MTRDTPSLQPSSHLEPTVGKKIPSCLPAALGGSTQGVLAVYHMVSVESL